MSQRVETPPAEAVFDFVQSSVNDDAAEPLLLCGDIDTTILRRLRPFRPIVLNDISDDSGFSLEELTFLCAHQCKYRVLGEDDYIFFRFYDLNSSTVTVPEWTSLAGSNERNVRTIKARTAVPQLVQATESSPFG